MTINPATTSSGSATIRRPADLSLREGNFSMYNISDFLTAKPVPPEVLVPVALGRKLADNDLIGLYQAIETALPDQESRVIQIMSSYGGEGTTTIGTELSALTSQMLGHHTLFIDVIANPSRMARARRDTLASLLDVATGRAILADAIIESSTDAMHPGYACLTSGNSGANIMPSIDKLRQIMTILRKRYKLIILHVSDILANPAYVSLSRLADGVVLVIEAERTRAPVAKQALALIHEQKVRVIGLALNKRRYYIPHWLYRWL